MMIYKNIYYVMGLILCLNNLQCLNLGKHTPKILIGLSGASMGYLIGFYNSNNVPMPLSINGKKINDKEIKVQTDLDLYKVLSDSTKHMEEIPSKILVIDKDNKRLLVDKENLDFKTSKWTIEHKVKNKTSQEEYKIIYDVDKYNTFAYDGQKPYNSYPCLKGHRNKIKLIEDQQDQITIKVSPVS